MPFKPEFLMNKTVYLINLSRKTNQIQLPIAFGVLTNTLKLHNISVKLIDLVLINEEDRIRFLKDNIPKEQTIFGFSIIAGNNHIQETEKYAKIILEENSAHIILYGGPLPSAVPNVILQNCLCKYIIAGEGEIVFPMLINSLFKNEFYPNFLGVFYKKNGKIVGGKNKVMRKLDKYSNVDFSLFDMDYCPIHAEPVHIQAPFCKHLCQPPC